MMTQQQQIIVDKLSKHPEIEARILQILRVFEDNSKELNSFDSIEVFLVKEFQKLGQEVLQGWATKEADRLANEIKNMPNATKHSKKN